MKCFYHRGDFDGKCAGAIVKLRHPRCEMIGLEYGEPFPWDLVQPFGGVVGSGPSGNSAINEACKQTVVMVDFSLQPFEDMIRLAKMTKLTWIDHHKTAIEERNRAMAVNSFVREAPPMESFIPLFARGVQEVGQAACELTFRYLCPGMEMPVAVRLLGRYDVWDIQNAAVLAFQYGMRAQGEWHPSDVTAWQMLFDDPGMVRDIIEKGSAVLDYERAQSAAYMREFGFVGDILPPKSMLKITALCVNLGRVSSMTFSSADPSVLLFCGYAQLPDGRWRVSLRRPDGSTVDCGAIAKAFGGGGHAGAAGFVADDLDWMQRVDAGEMADTRPAPTAAMCKEVVA